jgi:hypothetical protein
MSLCLALLLAAIAIDWWNGWKPFTHPFQMPGNPWLKRLSTIHRKRRRSTSCHRPIRRRARAAELPPRRLSPTADRRLLRTGQDHSRNP